MKKKNTLKIAVWAMAVLFVLTVTLCVHIYIVTHHARNDARIRQLSRIDFKEKPDAAEAVKIRGFVAGLEGVESTYFNVNDGILVYTYTIGKQSSSNVYDRLMASGHYKAEKYTVSEEDAKTGCPAMSGKGSLTGRMVSYISNL